MRTFAKVVAFTAAAALSLSACGRSDSDEAAAGDESSAASGFAADALIGVALPQKTSENWVLAETLFNDGLTGAGFQKDVQFANAGPAEQQNQIQTMVTKGAKVIIIGAIDPAQLTTQVKAAKDSGAIVIAYDRQLVGVPDVDYYVAYDAYKVGELQGQALLEGMAAKKPNGPYNIELFSGDDQDGNSAKFFGGAMSVLQPKIDDGTLKVVSGQVDAKQVEADGWKPENAQKRMDTLLTANYTGSTTIDGVLSPNDTLARAILDAVAQAGKPLPVVTGQDSEVESVKSIMEGKQYSTINKDTTKLVEAAIAMVQQLQKGEEATTTTTDDNGQGEVPTNFLEPQIVTKENAAESYAGTSLEQYTK